jgi:hypothetical protein
MKSVDALMGEGNPDGELTIQAFKEKIWLTIFCTE